MYRRVLTCGLTGGLLSALALTLPLYFQLPTRYSTDWPGVSGLLGGAGYVIAALCLAGTGYLAARWSAAGGGGALRAGAVAGALAGLLAFMLIGAGAAGVAGAGEILTHGPRPTQTQQQFQQLIAEATVRITWWTYLTLLGMLAAGALLGAAGARAAPQRQAHSLEPAPPSGGTNLWDVLAQWLILFSFLMLMLNLALFAMLAEKVAQSATDYAFTLSLPWWGIRDWPLAANLATLLAGVWLGWQAVRQDEADLRPEQREVGRVTGWMLLVWPMVVLPMAALIHAPIYGDPVFLVGAGLLVALTLRSARRAWGGRYAVLAVASAGLSVAAILMYVQAPTLVNRLGRLMTLVLLVALTAVLLLTLASTRRFWSARAVAPQLAGPVEQRPLQFGEFALLFWLLTSAMLLIGGAAQGISMMWSVIDFIGVLQGSPEPYTPSTNGAIQSIFTNQLASTLVSSGVCVVLLPLVWLVTRITERRRAVQQAATAVE